MPSDSRQRKSPQDLAARVPNWSVRDAKPDDASFITRLWCRYFGDFDGIPGVVKLGVDADDEYNYCNVAMADDQLVGCGIASVGPLEHIDQCIGIGVIDEYAAGGNGYLHFGGVKKPYRNRGVATALMQQRLGWMAGEAGANKVFGLAWVRDDHPDSRPVFEGRGFEEIRHLENYYQEYGERDRCPDCGEACTCDAVLYGRSLP